MAPGSDEWIQRNQSLTPYAGPCQGRGRIIGSTLCVPRMRMCVNQRPCGASGPGEPNASGFGRLAPSYSGGNGYRGSPLEATRLSGRPGSGGYYVVMDKGGLGARRRRGEPECRGSRGMTGGAGRRTSFERLLPKLLPSSVARNGTGRMRGDFRAEDARQSTTFRDVSIRAGVAEIDFQDPCQTPRPRGTPDRHLLLADPSCGYGDGDCKKTS